MLNIKTPEEMLELAESTGLCGGTIFWDDKSVDVEVLYISSTGARVSIAQPDDLAAIQSAVHVTFQVDRFKDLRASVIWQRDSIVGLQFDGAAELGLLAEDDPNVSHEPVEVSADCRRRFPRKRVMLAAGLESNGTEYTCRILDISLVGARLQIEEDLPAEDLMQLVTKRFGLLPVEVMWRVAEHVGVQFLEPPDTISMILKDFLTE
ncbi:MAG: PilZ domain-containing protein [Pseudomonadota bacterium]